VKLPSPKFLNDLDAMLRAWRHDSGRPAPADGTPHLIPTDSVPVYNNSGEDVPANGLVWIVDVRENEAYLEIAKPAHPWLGRLGIATAAIPEDGEGRVWIDGQHDVLCSNWATLPALPAWLTSATDSFQGQAIDGGDIPILAKSATSGLVRVDLSAKARAPGGSDFRVRMTDGAIQKASKLEFVGNGTSIVVSRIADTDGAHVAFGATVTTT